MKKHIFIAAAVLAGSVVVGTWLLLRKSEVRSPKSEIATKSDGSVRSEPGTPTSERSPIPILRNSNSAPPVHVEKIVSIENGSQNDVVRVPSAKELAKVNGATITLKDLLPVKEPHAEQVMSPETYKFLLERAITRELTLQKARAGGIELTPEQLAQREQVRRSIIERQGDPAKVVHLSGSGSLEREIEFEQRDATSELLLNSLLEKAGITPYLTDSQVRQYYEGHQQEFGALPAQEAERAAVWQHIDLTIRQRLAPLIQAQYQDQRQKYLEELKTRASIIETPPNS